MNFKLVLTWGAGDNFEVNHLKQIEARDLVQLASKFAIMMLEVARELHEEELAELRIQNDDIPF